eukprot:5028444-Pyramimonas_sp.AAC.1
MAPTSIITKARRAAQGSVQGGGGGAAPPRGPRGAWDNGPPRNSNLTAQLATFEKRMLEQCKQMFKSAAPT